MLCARIFFLHSGYFDVIGNIQKLVLELSYTGRMIMDKEARNSKMKYPIKIQVCILTTQSSGNVNAKYLLNEYILVREKWAQKMKEKGRKKKAERQKNDISTDISVHKNL